MKIFFAAILFAAGSLCASASRPTDYVDPRIGSEGLGRVYIGPTTPFGMVRPGPDCTPGPNSGWLPMPVRVDGFAQTHVSGTGGGPKYGNILIQPFSGPLDSAVHHAQRQSETIRCGYYATTFSGSGISTEITATPRAAVYRFAYPAGSRPALMVDAGFFLGETPTPDAREAQQFIGSEVAIVGSNAVEGYSRIRGGWNNGPAYTVYFYLEADRPFASTATFTAKPFSEEPAEISTAREQYDRGLKTGALLGFAEGTDTLNVRVGISFLSERKARENLMSQTSGRSFEQLYEANLAAWDDAIGRISLGKSTPDSIRRMLYTGLYHTMLMPSDRTGENPLWTDPDTPYYDDFYAIWDTYRTSSPLLTLIAPERQADIVNSLINIGHRDGFMPDARSGNANGRTQGGSNADIVLADACVKGLPGIDYNAALRQMLVDGEVDPGARHEAEGRGGLTDYIRLGYVPHGTDRAGNRTVEYSLCDFAIAQVARHLAANEPNAIRADSLRAVADKYDLRSHNWRNLWRPDATQAGVSGFIMPRDASGRWIDSIPFGHSELQHPRFAYHPLMFEGPWYTPWWSMFFYEASSWEYSLSMPHDVPLLIEACGGPEAFEKRLDTFFDRGFYNVNNEPSFLTPSLYHWIGRADRSSDRAREIVKAHFSDAPDGLPGNDDSGAMSSWLVCHLLGLYPNAATDLYLIHAPMVEESEIDLGAGKRLRIVAEGFAPEERPHVVRATLNGRELPDHFLSHADLMQGGELRLTMGRVDRPRPEISAEPVVCLDPMPTKKEYKGKPTIVTSTYRLHGQRRRFRMEYQPLKNGGILLTWGIERNLRWWQGCYLMTPEAVAEGTVLDYTMPEDGNRIALPADATFGILSRRQLEQLRAGATTISGVEFRRTDRGSQGSPNVSDVSNVSDGSDSSASSRRCPFGPLIEAVDPAEGARILVVDRPDLPLIWSMTSNPLEIDWTCSPAE